MRRFLLTYTVLVCAGWSQPAQQQPSPPLVVKVEMPPIPKRDFLGYLQALGPLIAACVAVGVATMQQNLQRQSQKQDLFEKCFHIYKAADDFVADTIHRNCRPDRESYHTFLHATDPARFLFGADVLEALEWIKDETGRLATESDVPVERQSEQTESQRSVSVAVRMAAFSIKWDNRKVVFWPYLQLQHNQPFYARLEAYMRRVS
jgi:hypothetical protein